MASTTAWIAGRLNSGAGLTWFSANFTSGDFQSKAQNALIISTAIVNGTTLDTYADVSFSIIASATASTAASGFALYLFPLNQDGTTYGYAPANGDTSIPASYMVKTCGVKVGVSSGNLTGIFRGIVLPPGSFLWGIQNLLAGGLPASGTSTVQMRSYNENLNA